MIAFRKIGFGFGGRSYIRAPAARTLQNAKCIVTALLGTAAKRLINADVWRTVSRHSTGGHNQGIRGSDEAPVFWDEQYSRSETPAADTGPAIKTRNRNPRMRCMVAVFQMPVSRPISGNSFTQNISIRKRPIVKENEIGRQRPPSFHTTVHTPRHPRETEQTERNTVDGGRSKSIGSRGDEEIHRPNRDRSGIQGNN